MDRPTLLLADDHVIVADGLRSLLKDEFELVGKHLGHAQATYARADKRLGTFE